MERWYEGLFLRLLWSLQLIYCININANEYKIILQVASAFKNLLLCVKNDQSGSVDPTQFRNIVGQFKVCHSPRCTYRTFSWMQGFTEFKNKICLAWIFCWRRAAGLPWVCLKDVRMAPRGHEQVIFLTLNDRVYTLFYHEESRNCTQLQAQANYTGIFLQT
jgi:hypothetical protein